MAVTGNQIESVEFPVVKISYFLGQAPDQYWSIEDLIIYQDKIESYFLIINIASYNLFLRRQ